MAYVVLDDLDEEHRDREGGSRDVKRWNPSASVSSSRVLARRSDASRKTYVRIREYLRVSTCSSSVHDQKTARVTFARKRK